MRPQGSRPRRLIRGIDVVGVGAQRDLGIDDQMLVVRQIDDGIRALAPAFTAEGHLTLELDPLSQAGALEHGLQNHLAPVALHLAVALERT